MKQQYKIWSNLVTALVLGTIISVALTMLSCTDDCESTETYIYLEPIYTTASEVRSSFASLAPKALENPGKIYRKDHYLFVSERGKGIHIFDNNDKTNPTALSFINIPGSFDVAVKGDIMYVDSFVDLVVLDISNPRQVEQVVRIENVLNNFEIMGFYSSEETGFITDFTEIESIQVNDCAENPVVFPNRGGGIWLSTDQAARALSSAESNSGSSGSGLGGSFARFAIHTNFLYVVDSWTMHVFDIDQLRSPNEVSLVELGWGIETIFPYHDKLFIGSNTGMQIFDNSDPRNPTFLSGFAHAMACDPVVAQDDIAYITLRTGNRCFGIDNQLDVVDISTIERPQLLKSYPMEHPHGLAIDSDILFVCEGKYGLKVFDAGNNQTIDQNLIAHLKDIHAYDVIAIDSHLILVGDDGIYQYDYANPEALKLLSVINSK
ncbi:MAG: hypothetical protein DHS20C17_23920 [Cyclobacteriaceae bacterium]|nr:MAG: hypothetical protein DHS20C17_23920 [Cyclobacteriaceae bacterium]